MTDLLDVASRRQGQRPLHAWESDWTADRIDTLTRMYAEGFSQRQIADELGVNRGSVAGKISRLGLSGRAANDPDHTRWRRPTRSKKAAAAAVQAAPLLAAPAEGRVTLADLDRGMCRFPYGERTFLFCGDPTNGASYCAAHHRIAYRSESTSA